MTNGQNEVGKFVNERQAKRKTLIHLRQLIKYFKANEVCPVALGTAARSLKMIVCESECTLPSDDIYADETPLECFEHGYYGIQNDLDLLDAVGFDGDRVKRQENTERVLTNMLGNEDLHLYGRQKCKK